MTPYLPAPQIPDWLAEDLPFDRFSVDVDGERMHVMRREGNGQTVLLVHGNPTWGYLYRNIASPLADEGFDVVIPDLIGLGFSSKPADAQAHQLENHARWLRRLIETLDLRDVIVVVQDWGGPIGTLAFEEEPQRLAGMTVLNTVLSEPKPDFKATLFHKIAHTPVISDTLFRYLGFPQINLGMAQGDSSSMSGKTGKAYRYPLRTVTSRMAPLALARMVPDDFDHPSIEPLTRTRELVESLDVPTAMVWGHKDPVLGRAFSWIKELTGADYVVETGAGHFIQEEVPEEIAQAIRWVAEQVE
jgi:haloalkane dehalogenase